MKQDRIFLFSIVLAAAFVVFAGCTSTPPVPVTTTPVPSQITMTPTAPITTPSLPMVTTPASTTISPTILPTTTMTTTVPTPTTTVTNATAPASMNIMDTLVADGRFTTLVTALKAAHLDANLSGPGPYTLFAPPDAAFSKLPTGTLDSLLLRPQASLRDILLYHMVDKKMMSADIARVGTITTLEKHTLLVGYSSGTITLNGVKVTQPDIVCSNGVIHVVDTVLIPQVQS